MKDAPAWLDELTPNELLDVVCPPEHALSHISHGGPTGALKLWRRELSFGVRHICTADTLNSAVCMEMSGLDALRDGLPLVASDWFAQADRSIENAAARRREQRASPSPEAA